VKQSQTILCYNNLKLFPLHSCFSRSLAETEAVILIVLVMATAALAPLDPLFRMNAKRTREIFASAPEDGMNDEERR
jgi:hypothetical protein